MKKISLRVPAFFIFVIFVAYSFAAGCGGGGGSSPLAFYDGQSNISLKLLMLNRTPGAAYVSIPRNAAGTVTISVVSVKSGKEVAVKTVDYALGEFVFENQVPAGDTYSVVVTARLKERANDIYQSVWQGAGTVAVLSAERAARTPGANELTVALVFKTIEFIKLYPTKIAFDPALPLSKITTSTIIPPFRVSVLDQFGNIMTSENNLITVTIENGSFKDSINSKKLTNGSAYFSDLVVATLIPDGSGFVKLKAVYGSLTGYGAPIKTAGVAIPDSAVAGYLNDEKTTAAPAAGGLHAPLAGKEIRLVCGNIRYSCVTDQNGFFRIDARAGAPGAAAYFEFGDASGRPVRLDTVLSPGQVKLAAIRFDASGAARLATSVLNIAYGSSLTADQLKKAVDDDGAARAAFGGAAGISGVAIDAATGRPISSATVTIDKIGITAQTDSYGRFSITASTGQLAEGSYIISLNRGGYLASSKTIGISPLDYGFMIEALKLEAAPRQNTPPSVVIKSVSGSSRDIAIVFDLIDPDGDACNIEVQYSLNGGLTYFTTVNAGGALSGVLPGGGHSAVWFSASDFLTKQASVRLKLVPRDPSVTGTAGESDVFAVDNEIVNPENNPPVIMGVMADGAAGDILVSFDLIDQDGDSCAVELYYSLDGGSTFVRSSNYSLYNQRVFPAAALKLVWNSALDFQTHEKSVRLRLTPNDSKSGGTSGESGIFEVNNIKNTPPVIQNLSATGSYKDISLSYDLIELDGHLCTVEVYFSVDGGVNYFPTARLSGETSSVAPGTKTLVWHSYLDFAVTHKSVFVKLVPSDKYGYGTEAVFGPFEINNAGFAPSITGLAITGSSRTIDIKYDLAGIDSSLSTIEVFFSLDGGNSFRQTGYVEGDISGVTPGAGKTIKWNSYGDFRTHERSVVLKLSPIDGFGRGTEAVSLPFGINNDIYRPSITNVRTKGNFGEIEIAYDIEDLDGSACQVAFMYSTEKSGGYLASRNIIGATAEVLTGKDRTLIWNSRADFTANYDSVGVKLIASDGEGPGGEALSQAFKVYNNATGELTINSLAGASQNVTVNFKYADAEGDAANFVVSYSRDGGASFIPTGNISGAVSGVLPADNLSIIWHSSLDIVNQNASVILRIAAYDNAGKLMSQAFTRPFTVNNFVQPAAPPKVMSAGFYFDGELYWIKLKFDQQISTSSTIDKSKIIANGVTLSSIYNSGIVISGDTVSFSRINNAGYGAQDFIVGVNGEFTASRGLQILSGNGIKNLNGVETQATADPLPISHSNGAPKLLFSNARRLFATAGAFSSNIQGHFDIYIGAAAPDIAATAFASSNDGTNHNFSVNLNSSFPPGQRVFYRFAAAAGAGGARGAWVDFGAIPDQTTIFEEGGSKNIAWSNLRSSVEVLRGSIGQAGDQLKLYQYDGAEYLYKGSAEPAGMGGYYAGWHPVTYNSAGVSIATGSQPAFTFTGTDGIESGYYLLNILPAPPSALSSIFLKHNGANYQFKTNGTAFTLDYGVRAYSATNEFIARIPAGNYAASTFITSYLETNSPECVNNFSASGQIRFVYVDDSGTESETRDGPNIINATPGKLGWSNAGVNPSVLIYGSLGTVSSGDVIQIFTKSGPSYSPNGSITAGASGFNDTTVTNGSKISTGVIVAFKYIKADGNESPINDDGAVPAPPTAEVADNLRLAYNGMNYEVKNISASDAYLTHNLGIFVANNGCIGIVDKAKSALIAANGFPEPNAYASSAKAPASLDDGPAACEGGALKFTYISSDGHQSDFYANGSNLPAAPLYQNLHYARTKYQLLPNMSYRIFAYNGTVTLTAGMRIYIGALMVRNLNLGQTIVANSFSDATLSAAPDGGKLAFTTSGDGNESAKYYGDLVPKAPNRSEIKWLNGGPKFKALASFGTSSEKLRVYEKNGFNYILKANASNWGPYVSNNEYATDGTAPLITGGQEVAYTMINISNYESIISETGKVPATPSGAEMLRTAYNPQMDYLLKNTSTSTFMLPTGTRMDIYINGVLSASQSAEGEPKTIPAGGFSNFTLNPPSGAGALVLTFTDIESGNEAQPVASTTVPAAPSFGTPIISFNENNSINSANYINKELALSIVNLPNSNDNKLGINFNSPVGSGGTVFLHLSNPVSGNTADLNFAPTISGLQIGEFTLVTTPGPLSDALDDDGGGGGTGLDGYLYAVNSDGNASWYAMDSGTIRYDITPPEPISVKATLASDGTFTHNGTDMLEITFAENILFKPGFSINDICFPVYGDGFGNSGTGCQLDLLEKKIIVTAPNDGAAYNGAIKKDGLYDSNSLTAGSPSGIYLWGESVKDEAGNWLVVPTETNNAMDIE